MTHLELGNSSANTTIAEEAVDNSDPLYDAGSAAKYLGLNSVVKHPGQAVRTLCRKHRLRSTRIAGKVMVRRSWLESYIAENSRDARGEG